jgi:hypothetical protein
MFKKHVPTPTRYSESDLRNDVQAALERGRKAGIHSVILQRVIHGIADSEAQRRAMFEPVI